MAVVIGSLCFAACRPSGTPAAAAPATAPAPAPATASAPAPAPAPAPAAAQETAATSAKTSAASSSGDAPATKTIPRSDACSDDPTANLQRGRKFAAAGKWEEAVLAYDPGVHRAPGNPVLRAERGYALFKAGLVSEAAGELGVALGLTDDRALQSAIHFNLALAHGALGNAERARIHLSSAAERGNAAARKRLGDASRCRATWHAKPEFEPAPIAANLRALVGARQFVNCPDHPEPKTEAEAAAILCRGCGGGSWNDEACDLSFPLQVADGYMHLHSFQFRAEAFPSRKHPYIYFNEWLDNVSVAKEPVWKVSGPYLVIETFSIDWNELDDGLGHPVLSGDGPVYTVDDQADPSAATTGCSPDVGSAEANMSHGGGALWGFGVPGRRIHSLVVYSVATRKPLLSVEAEDGAIGWKIRGKELSLTGAGCKETIAIPEG
ncbi:MAG: hypothetical protein QM784_09965 [Polyangiaceae bacterium]